MIEVELYKPHPKQQEIHKSIINDDAFYYVLNIGRQFGKTALLENQALFWLINEEKIIIGWVSPIRSQSKKSFMAILDAVKDIPIFKGKNESELVIYFNNGSRIEFYSAEQEDGIRGKTFHYLICDEFAFFKEDVWKYILRATILVKGRKCILSSTPKGKNHFFEMYNKAYTNERYIHFKGTSEENPYTNFEELEDTKKETPEMVWKQEYLAEFIDSASVFRNVDNCINNNPRYSNTYYIGIDIGFQKDYSVVTIMNDYNEMVEQNSINECTTSEVKSLIMKALKKYPDSIAYIELNNQGIAIYHDLIEEHGLEGQLIGVNTTAKTKPLFINNFIKNFSEGTISILDKNDLKTELDAYIFKVTKTGVLQFEASSGFHDDKVMSLAIATYCYFENHLGDNGAYLIG